MKYTLGSLTDECIDPYVRVTVRNVGGPGSPPRVAVTDQEFPTPWEVMEVVKRLRNIDCLDKAQQMACARAAQDAKEWGEAQWGEE